MIIFANFYWKNSAAFTRTLACMSKYSDELFINAISNSVTFSATNASLSAYCRFTYDRSFFTRFNVGGDRNMRDALPDEDDAETASGQLCVQVSFLRVKRLLLTQRVNCSPY